MPKLVCTPCQVELRPERNGVNVIEHSDFGPYKIWFADEWKCPNCGATIIAGFANYAFSEHYENDFGTILERIQEHPDELRHDYENQSQRAQALMQRANTETER